MTLEMLEVIQPLEALRADLRSSARTMTPKEARFLVDYFYIIQDDRKKSSNQRRAMEDEPHVLLQWLNTNEKRLEAHIKAALGEYSMSQATGRWAQSIKGIAGVLSAGLLAHIDIEKAPSVGHIWNFAGLNPGVTWAKGEKRPWNAALKVVCWKIGESFMKQSNRDDDVYGHLYAEQKERYIRKNEAGGFQPQAAAKLERYNIGKQTPAYAAYSTGFLPPAHIHEMAKRWATKLFLSHWHHVAYENAYGIVPQQPYAFSHLGHVHMMPVPNHVCVE